MLNYYPLSKTDTINYLKNNNYDHYWYQNTTSPSFFLRPVDCYGISDDDTLKGIFLLENWEIFFEGHIFTDRDIRGRHLIELIKLFLELKISYYKLIIGRIPRNGHLQQPRASKATKRFAKWLGMRPIKSDSRYDYVGIGTHESI